MALTYKEIEVLVTELRTMVLGGTLSNCFQFERKRLILCVEKRQYTHNLLIVLQQPHVRMHLTRMRTRPLKDRLPFGEYVKKQLLETRVIDITQLDGDRIVRFDFEAEKKLSLIIELFSRGGSVYLVDHDGTIQAALSGSRTGEKYGHTPSEPRAEREITVPEGELYNFILDEKYHRIDEELEFAAKKKHVLEHVRRKKKKLERLVSNLKKDHEKCRNWEEFNLYGELLKANLYALKENADTARVLNYYTDEEIDVPLDKKVSPRANMARYFKKAGKLRRGLGVIEKNLERAEKKLSPIETQLSALEKIADLEEFQDYIAANSISIPAAPRKRREERKKKPSPFRYFISNSGHKIYVGRSNKENDKLTISQGKGSDFWCHAHGYPGSHVLVPVPKNTEIDHQTFLDAVNLALYHSRAKTSGAGDVLYTERRHVSKTKGMAPGKVNVSKHRVIHVKLDEERIRNIRERTREEIGNGAN